MSDRRLGQSEGALMLNERSKREYVGANEDQRAVGVGGSSKQAQKLVLASREDDLESFRRGVEKALSGAR